MFAITEKEKYLGILPLYIFGYFMSISSSITRGCLPCKLVALCNRYRAAAHLGTSQSGVCRI